MPEGIEIESNDEHYSGGVMSTSFTGGPAMGGAGQPMQVPAQPPMSTANGVYCRYCGATPALQVDIRGHRGLLIIMQFLRSPGPYCRDCGIATFRKMTEETLLLGWWGLLSVLITPFVLLGNLSTRKQLLALPAPIPGSPRPPMSPGKPLTHRPAGVIGLVIASIPVLIAVLILLLIVVGLVAGA
ncbi:hypothetical protein [Nocardia jejuensis]|uniref:hypothetical protein n=1 Tax=Nocardia jejuensis TaxID=328049 RepID=UPI0008338F2D|nr:hypothetical protein [Nocardia jejuensis]